MKNSLRAAIIAIFAMIVTTPSFATTPRLWIHSVYGDRETVFTIPSSIKPELQFFNNSGKQKSIRLSNKNFHYIMRQIASLSDSKNAGANCPRSRLEVMALTGRGVKHVVACINSPTANTTKLLELTNLLGIIL